MGGCNLGELEVFSTVRPWMNTAIFRHEAQAETCGLVVHGVERLVIQPDLAVRHLRSSRRACRRKVDGFARAVAAQEGQGFRASCTLSPNAPGRVAFTVIGVPCPRTLKEGRGGLSVGEPLGKFGFDVHVWSSPFGGAIFSFEKCDPKSFSGRKTSWGLVVR